VATFLLTTGAGSSGGQNDERPSSRTAKNAPPSVSAAVDLILVDAVVTDRQGRLVTGLGPDDFLLREDGVMQSITGFEAIDLGEASPQPAPIGGPRGFTALRSSGNVDRATELSHRTFVVVFDDVHLGAAGAIAASKAVAQFLAQSTRPGDLVSLVVPGTGLRWTAAMPEGREQLVQLLGSLRGQRPLVPEMISDFEAQRIAKDDDRGAADLVRRRFQVAGTLPDDDLMNAANSGPGGRSLEAVHDDQGQFVQAEARRVLDMARRQRRLLLQVAASVLDGLAAVRGRKSVFLVSEGFVHEPDEEQFREVVAASRRGNAAIYYLDAQRLGAAGGADGRASGDLSDGGRSTRPEETQGAEAVAEETGGFSVRNTNDLAEGLARISRESSSYYLVGYSSTNTLQDGGYRKISLEIKRSDAEVRARPGYYAPASDKPGHSRTKAGVERQLELALSAPMPIGQIPLRLAAFVRQPVDKGKIRVTLASEVGVERLQFEKGADAGLTATLDVAMELTFVKPAGRQVTPWREWRVTIPAQAQGPNVWIPLEISFDLPPGICQAKLVVRDRGSRAVGSVLHDFEVPEPGTWRISTPILSDVPGRERISPRLLAGRSFAAGTPLYCYVEVYNAARDSTAGTPRVSFAYALRDAGGKVELSHAATPLAPGARGGLERLLEIPLTRIAPGDYELTLTIGDDVAGRSEEFREPFSVRRPPRPNRELYADLVRTFLEGDAARAMSGLMQWPPRQLAELAASLPAKDEDLRRAALALHTDLAIRLWQSGRGAEADAQVTICRELLKGTAARGMHRDWLLTLGYFHQASSSPSKALPFFTECARLYPDAADAWLGAGTAYEYTAYPDGFGGTQAAVPAHSAAAEAERCYREAARLAPRLAEARLRLGRVLRLAGAFDEAERELKAAVDASEEGYLRALAHLFWGESREARGDLVAAIQHYQAALDADGDCQPAALALSQALYRSERPREARESLTPALTVTTASRHSPWLDYHLGLGRRYGSALAGLHEGLPVVAEATP
jgi:VWFA-related protein